MNNYDLALGKIQKAPNRLGSSPPDDPIKPDLEQNTEQCSQ
jgi:hypothetical protein